MQEHIDGLRAALNAAKPGDRSDLDRKVAILLTDLEKLEGLILAWNIAPRSGVVPAGDLGHRPEENRSRGVLGREVTAFEP